MGQTVVFLILVGHAAVNEATRRLQSANLLTISSGLSGSNAQLPHWRPADDDERILEDIPRLGFLSNRKTFEFANKSPFW